MSSSSTKVNDNVKYIISFLNFFNFIFLYRKVCILYTPTSQVLDSFGFLCVSMGAVKSLKCFMRFMYLSMQQTLTR